MVKHYTDFLSATAALTRRLPKGIVKNAARKVLGGSTTELSMFGQAIELAFKHCHGKARYVNTGLNKSIKAVVDSFKDAGGEGSPWDCGGRCCRWTS